MSRRDQPYLPLYVQDVLTDEKLIECSASAHGVYFRLLCILHKQETYGRILLKQKYKQMSEFCSGKSETNCEQNKDKDKNKDKNKANFFAKMLAKQMPFGEQVILDALIELLEEDVITIDGDMLFQKRMVKDGDLSEKRADFGKKGGNKATKQYGKPGILYLMSDGEKLNKIGTSANPINRLYRLRSNLKLPKHFEIRDQVEVADMGAAEDMCVQLFSDMMDGEWVNGPFDLIASKFASLKSKSNLKHKHFAQTFAQANVRANAENENEIENENDNRGIGVIGERENYIVPKLMSVWMSVFPQYPREDVRDFEAMRKIAEFIAGQLKVDIEAPENFPAITERFRKIAELISREDFWRGKPLFTIEKHIQDFFGKTAFRKPRMVL